MTETPSADRLRRSGLAVALLDWPLLVGIPLLINLAIPVGRHVMADRAATRRTQHAVMRHVTSRTADNGPLKAAFGLGLPRGAGRQGKRQRGR